MKYKGTRLELVKYKYTYCKENCKRFLLFYQVVQNVTLAVSYVIIIIILIIIILLLIIIIITKTTTTTTTTTTTIVIIIADFAIKWMSLMDFDDLVLFNS